MKKLLDQIEFGFNRLSDMNKPWWPFLFLRPPKDKKITRLINLKKTIAFGSFFYLPFLLLVGFLKQYSGELDRYGILTIISIAVFLYLFLYIALRTTTMFFWNRRVEKIIKNEHNQLNDNKQLTFLEIIKYSFLCGAYFSVVCYSIIMPIVGIMFSVAIILFTCYPFFSVEFFKIFSVLFFGAYAFLLFYGVIIASIIFFFYFISERIFGKKKQLKAE